MKAHNKCTSGKLKYPLTESDGIAEGEEERNRRKMVTVMMVCLMGGEGGDAPDTTEEFHLFIKE